MIYEEDGKVEVERPAAKWSNVNEYCETLEKLRNASYQHYLRRQTYEWKMCITIWTPLVATIGIILTKSNVHIGMIPLAIASVFIFCIHIVWQANLKKSNDLDIERTKKYETEIKKFVGMETNEERNGIFIFSGWSHYIYVLVTAGLIATSFYVNYSQRQEIITLPNDVQIWLKTKHHTNIQEKEKYIVKKLREEMDSERSAEQKAKTLKESKLKPRI